MKRTLLLNVLLLICSGLLLGQTPQRPHVFVVLVDDLGYGDLGITGHPFIKTPNIDSFAMQSRRLKYYSAHPVCSPSRVGLLTGQFPQRQGISNVLINQSNDTYELKPTEANIAQLLKDIGYFTFHCGKWHMNRAALNDSAFLALGFNESTSFGNKPSAMIFDKAQEYISESLVSDSLRPIFGYIALNDVHAPIAPKILPPHDQYIELYHYDTITTDHLCHFGTSFIEHAEFNFGDSLKYYYNAVSSMDDAFGNF